MTKTAAIRSIKKGLYSYQVAALLKSDTGKDYSYCTTKECVTYQLTYHPERVVKVYRYRSSNNKTVRPQKH